MTVREDWIQVQGLKVHCLITDRAGQSLILLHGGSVDSASLSWRPSMGWWGSNFPVIAPDLPGYGQSDKPVVDYSLAFYTAFLRHLAEEMKLARFHLVGLSMGGQIALNFTLQFPEMVSRLVLVNTAGIGTPLRWSILGRLLLKVPALHRKMRQEAGSRRTAVRLGLRTILYRKEAITDELVDEIADTLSLPDSGQAWRCYLRNELAWFGFRHGFLDRLCQISSPTLIVHGLQDRLIPVKWAQRAHRLIPDSQLCLIPRCGHWPPRESPEEFNQTVLRFLSG